MLVAVAFAVAAAVAVTIAAVVLPLLPFWGQAGEYVFRCITCVGEKLGNFCHVVCAMAVAVILVAAVAAAANFPLAVDVAIYVAVAVASATAAAVVAMLLRCCVALSSPSCCCWQQKGFVTAIGRHICNFCDHIELKGSLLCPSMLWLLLLLHSLLLM